MVCYSSSLNKTPDENNLEKENFILAYGFWGSFHGQSTPLLWAQGEVELHSKRMWRKSTVLLKAARKQRRQGEGATEKMNPSWI